MLRYAVVGAGAVGGFYGIRLAAAGAPVQFLVRSASEAEAIRSDGLHLSSPGGDRHLTAPLLAGSWDELQPCDVLLVAVKATANHDVLAALRAHADRLLGRSGVVLLVQNGIGAEAGFAAAAGGREVLGGLAFLCAQRVGPGRVRHLDHGALTLAAHGAQERPAGVTAAMRWIAEDLIASGVECALDEDLVRARWRKLMWNIPFNPLSVILNASTAELMADRAARDLIARVMAEVAAVAAAEGHALPAGLAADLLAITERMTPYDTSMKLDADAGRPLEVDAILGGPRRRAALAGVPAPALGVLCDQLSFLSERIVGH